jgi:peptidoglycan/LPS O-acetylase OafA/YrhL
MSRARPSRPASPDGLVTGYRPWLDGLRAVAVLMVLAQHTIGRMPLDLGFVGVGLFFALSGYLITGLLLDERAARGAVSLYGFYLRRAARLVPALVIVVVACNTLFVIQNDYAPLKGSISALTYTANYAEVLRGDFVRGYGPTWSLAVEEHFYVLWPLLLLWVTRRFGLRTALRATLAVCLVALLWRSALAVMHVRYSLLALGSLERADALLYGCTAAIAVRLGWRPRPWMLWTGIGIVGILPFAFSHESYAALVIGNAALAIAGAAVVVGLDYAARPWLRNCMSVRWLVVVGILSYGIYLWHGPMMRIAENFGYSGPGWRAVAVVVSITVAAVSYRYAEAPVRSWARRQSKKPRPDTPAPHPAVEPSAVSP